MKYLVVIPARGGSKGIPHKNIVEILGKPLIEYTIETMNQVSYDGDLVVSTDDIAIENVVKKYQTVTVVRRPIEIAGDTARTEDALLHVLHYMKQHKNKEYDAVITLQATSPLRRVDTILKMMKQYEKDYLQYDSLLTLTEDRGDYWIKNEKQNFVRLFSNAPRRRQEREPIYLENSALYITSVAALERTSSVLGEVANGYILDFDESVDINEYSDILLAENLLKRRKNNECDYN